MFGWFKSEHRERRRKVRLDRKHLEARSRRFLKSFLDADETRKPSSIARSKRHLSGAIQRHPLPNLMMLKSQKPRPQPR